MHIGSDCYKTVANFSAIVTDLSFFNVKANGEAKHLSFTFHLRFILSRCSHYWLRLCNLLSSSSLFNVNSLFFVWPDSVPVLYVKEFQRLLVVIFLKESDKSGTFLNTYFLIGCFHLTWWFQLPVYISLSMLSSLMSSIPVLSFDLRFLIWVFGWFIFLIFEGYRYPQNCSFDI